jgi:hypothetical protein
MGYVIAGAVLVVIGIAGLVLRQISVSADGRTAVLHGKAAVTVASIALILGAVLVIGGLFSLV